MRSDGYVEDLFVNTTGQNVRAGEPLFRVYSPDIQQALSELLVARAGHGAARRKRHGNVRVDGAMQRLRNLGVPESRIREMREQRRRPAHHRLAGAGDSGTVIGKRIINGQRVVAGDELYRIVDLIECLGDRRCRGRRSRRHQAGRARHCDVPRLSQPAGRWRRDLHLSRGQDGNAHRSCQNRSRQSGRAAEAGHVRRRRVSGRSRPHTRHHRSDQRHHRQRNAPDRAGGQGRRPLRAARRSSSAAAAMAMSKSSRA